MRIDYDLNPTVAAMKVAMLDDNKLEVTSAVARFDTEGQWKDSYGDFFTSETDFSIELPCKIGVYVDHGFNTLFGVKKIAVAELFLGNDEYGDGIFHKAVLDLNDPEQAFLAEKIKNGEIGASSGAVSHLVRYQYLAEFSAWKILNWAIGELSYTTVKSADTRNVVSAKFDDRQVVSFSQRYSNNIVEKEDEPEIDYSSGNALISNVLTLLGD